MAVQNLFDSALSFLEGLYFGGIKLGLDTSYRMLRCVNEPHQQLRFVHVGGTNGKGSVCSMLASALTNSGLKTGLYTSPHLVSICERFQINGKPIPETEFAELVFLLRERMKSLFGDFSDLHPTFFEFTTVLAFLYFQREQVDIAVLEVGMGGRLDCTNVVTPLLSIITNVDYDHTKFLGTQLKEIAKEKAGIIKAGVPVICGDWKKEVKEVMSSCAASRNAELYSIGEDFDGLDYQFEKRNIPLTQANQIRWKENKATVATQLLGKHQCQNAAIVYSALMLLQRMDVRFSLHRALKGIEACVWPGRFQILPDNIVVDAAHNVGAINQLVATLSQLYVGAKWSVLFGVLRDKNWQDMLKSLVAIGRHFYLIEVKSPRAESPARICDYIVKHFNKSVAVTIVDNVETGLAQLKSTNKGLVVGSSYLVGEVLSIYRNEVDHLWQ